MARRMTWGAFVKAVEAAGVRADDEVEYIDWAGSYGATPPAVEITEPCDCATARSCTIT
jgi:hypothetical protein